MGTDNLFSRNKSKKIEDLQRKKESREPYDKVLIVCEGEKTEPYYLIALIDHLKLSQANIKIDPDSDSSPTSVVSYTKDLIKESRSDPYNHAFCVIDRDRHADFDKAMNQIKGFKSKDTKLHAVVSYPCFEYWILLHFTYTRKIFGVSGDSPCDDLIKSDLKIYIPDYEKGDKNQMLPLIENGLERALAFAKKAYEESQRDETKHSTTKMHELVEYLKKLKA